MKMRFAQEVDRRGILRTKADRIAGRCFGLIIACYVLADLLRPRFVGVTTVQADSETGHKNPLIVSAIHLFLNVIIIAPTIYLWIRGRLDFRRVTLVVPIFLGLVIVAGLSEFADARPQYIVYVATLALTLLAATTFAAAVSDEGLEIFFVTAAIGMVFALLIAVWMNEYVAGRLASRAGPTYWGMVGIGCYCSATCIRRLWLRYSIMAVAVVVLLLCSARGALLSVFVGTMVWAGISIITAKRNRGYYALAVMLAIVVLAAGAPYIMEHVFQVSSSKRGLDSGATGRAAAWFQTWELFKAHPVLGVGYRQHERYITAASSAHEAYLAVLAEMGVPGFALYCVLVVGGMIRATREALRTQSRVMITSTVFLWSYLAIGFTENLALATGLALPLVMMFTTARAWSRDLSPAWQHVPRPDLNPRPGQREAAPVRPPGYS